MEPATADEATSESLSLPDASGAEFDTAQWADTQIIVSVRNPLSPFARSTWEWKIRGASAMLTWRHVNVDGFGDLRGLSLVSVEYFRSLLDSLDACLGRGETVETSEAVTTPRDAAVTFTVVQGPRRVDRRWYPRGSPVYDECVVAVAAPSIASSSPMNWSNPFWIPGEYGWISTRADRRARVYIDGYDTGRDTPISGMPAEVGTHTLRWETQGAESREEIVQVEAGYTTTINVRFGESPQ